eukprot:TRINITY_DN2338_c0_g1_i13.p1 TRINITY_DN2338_c0_g1~~TRINITY_DN2338_c0_g1_i13.p1  ORF type:complete len:222 (-),score=35.93 TRINITY_DN2338_c0_g1_i13:1958-2623(-)
MKNSLNFSVDEEKDNNTAPSQEKDIPCAKNTLKEHEKLFSNSAHQLLSSICKHLDEACAVSNQPADEYGLRFSDDGDDTIFWEYDGKLAVPCTSAMPCNSQALKEKHQSNKTNHVIQQRNQEVFQDVERSVIYCPTQDCGICFLGLDEGVGYNMDCCHRRVHLDCISKCLLMRQMQKRCIFCTKPFNEQLERNVKERDVLQARKAREKQKALLQALENRSS